MNGPKVSIIMSTYNRSTLIGESIQSVLNQTYELWELLVVDDGSVDNTREVVQAFRDDRIRYFAVPHSGYLGQVKNVGLSNATGDLIAFQDSDDLWRNDKLTFQIALLNKYPEASFVLSNGNQFGEFATETPDYQNLFVGNLFLPIIEESKFCFYCPSLIFRRNVISKIGLLDETIPFMRELHFFLRMAVGFNGIFTNERLINIRKHSGNFSNTFLADAHINNLKMLEEFRMAGSLNEKQNLRLSAICYYKIGLLHLRRNEGDKAVRSFKKYTRLRPLHSKGWMRLIQSHLTWLLGKATATAGASR